jgi:hypothetical protein
MGDNNPSGFTGYPFKRGHLRDEDISERPAIDVVAGGAVMVRLQ